jgi:hypothetical protein
MTSAYLNLNARGGALARLTILRGIAAHSNAPDVNLPPSKRFADWRAAREFGFNTRTLDLCEGYNVEYIGNTEKRRPIWSTFAGPRFRNEEKIHDVRELNIRHSGWYADADCSATVCGIVARLPHDRWMAGYYSSENGERVYLARVFDTLEEAAQEADDEARRIAEDEKEYSERYQAAHDLDDEIAQRETDVRELFPMRHHARARRELAAAVDTLRTLRARRDDEYSDIE